MFVPQKYHATVSDIIKRDDIRTGNEQVSDDIIANTINQSINWMLSSVQIEERQDLNYIEKEKDRTWLDCREDMNISRVIS